MLTPIFCPSPFQLPYATTDMVCRWNTVSDTPEKTPYPLPRSHIWYAGQATSFLAATMQEIEIYPSKSPFPSRRVGHCQHFPAHYDLSFPLVYLLMLSLSSHISSYFLILRHLQHNASLLLTPPIILTLWHIYYSAVSIEPHLHHHILCHTCLPSLSYRVSDFAVLINLFLPWIFHLPLSTSSWISDSAIFVILYICRIYSVSV